jgi:hypothetical protein
LLQTALHQGRRRLHSPRHDPHQVEAACCKSLLTNPKIQILSGLLLWLSDTLHRLSIGDARSNNAQTVDIAKYFVPASAIRAFIPTEYRF